MNADTVCLACCRNKAEGLLEQYGVSEETREILLKRIDKFLKKDKRTGDMPAPVMMAVLPSRKPMEPPFSSCAGLPRCCTKSLSRAYLSFTLSDFLATMFPECCAALLRPRKAKGAEPCGPAPSLARLALTFAKTTRRAPRRSRR